MTAEEPTPPAPLPEGKGEFSTGAPLALDSAPNSVSPFPSGRGAGGVGSSRRRFAFLGAGVAALAVAAFALWYFALRGPRDDLGRFQGEWRLTTIDRERQLPITVRVTGDKWMYLVADKDQKRYTITLRPDANPKEIDLTQLAADGQPQLEKRDGQFVPVVHRGIYQIEGDRAKLATAPNPLPRPTSFDATDGAPVLLLERQ